MKDRVRDLRRRVLAHLIFAACLVETSALAQVSFSSDFQPSTIGPGSISTLTFTITNPTATPVMDLAFSNTLPSGVTIATPAKATTTCVNALISAADGGLSFSMFGGRVGALSACTVRVDVTSAAPATYNNQSGDLTHSEGNSGPTTALLTVDANRPGFTKSFAPTTIRPGGVSTLTFTVIDPGTTGFFNFDFSDPLPLGMVVSASPDASTDCENANFAPTPGASSLSFSAFNTTPGLTCFVSVDVTTTAAGTFGNTSNALNSSARGNGGKAGAVLQVELRNVLKRFVDDPAPPGGTVTVEYTLTTSTACEPPPASRSPTISMPR